MDQTPAQPAAPKSNPLPLIFIAIGGAGCFGVLLLGAILAWIFWPTSKPKAAGAPAIATTSTALAAKETVVGEPGSAQVTVPAGAVDKDVSFALTPQSKEPRTSPGVRVLGNVWSMRVDGHARYKFNKPVRIALPFDRSRAKNGNSVALSWWDGRRWQEVAGSRVEDDRVVGDVDHFTDFGATEKDPETALPPSWTDIGSWYVDFDISTSGHWSTNYIVGSTDWTVSRRGSASFRLSSPFPGGNKAKWSIPAKPSPEDACFASVDVADGGYRTDNDHDKSGNVFYYSNWTGSGSSSNFSADLEIDVAAGTYRLVISTPKIGKVDFKDKSSPPGFGKEASGSADASFSFHSGPLPLPGAIGPILGHVADEESKINGGVAGSGIESTPAPKGAIRTEVSWAISPGPPGLKAKIDGPRVVRRGDGIKLDGTKSTGDVVEYLWRFDVGAGCPKGPQEKVELRTPTVEFTALWDFDATLEIKDKSGKKDKDVRHVKVTARKGYDWETRFKMRRRSGRGRWTGRSCSISGSTSARWTATSITAATTSIASRQGRRT